ncbi:MAG: hypothetical protein AB4050_17775 [Synechococcus sp.]
MKVPNWKASGRQQEKGRKRHRRRQQKAKAFKALVKKLQTPRQLPGAFCTTSPFICLGQRSSLQVTECETGLLQYWFC